MHRLMISAALLSAIASAPLFAQNQGSTQQEAAKATPANDYDRIQCRRDLVRGSLSQTRRICMTRREWDSLAAQARDAMYEDIRQRNGTQRGGM